MYRSTCYYPGAAAVIRATQGQGSGVFIDGLHKIVLSNCHYKTCGPHEDQCCEMTEQDEMDFNNAMVQSVTELRAKLPQDNIILGNGLQNYDFNAGLGTPTYDLFVDAVDGFSMEHMMAFEVGLYK